MLRPLRVAKALIVINNYQHRASLGLKHLVMYLLLGEWNIDIKVDKLLNVNNLYNTGTSKKRGAESSSFLL
jgi:hypothetical protein